MIFYWCLGCVDEVGGVVFGGVGDSRRSVRGR